MGRPRKQAQQQVKEEEDEDDAGDLDDAVASAPANVLTVHNVLASGLLSCSTSLDLDKCCTALGNSYYCPSEFPALRVDVRGSRVSMFTISIFESGRIQSVGGCRPREARKAMMKIGKRLNLKFNYGIVFQNFEIKNVLAVFDACTPVSLSQFSATFTGSVDYEPERFPSARVRIPIPPRKGVAAALLKSEMPAEEEGVKSKLRKLMMGGDVKDGQANNNNELAGAVGSYLIAANAKRPTSASKEDSHVKTETSVTANVFSTGKITFTGAKSVASLNYALSKLKPFLGLETAESTYGGPLDIPPPPSDMNAALRDQILFLQQQQIDERAHELMYPPLLHNQWNHHQSSNCYISAFRQCVPENSQI